MSKFLSQLAASTNGVWMAQHLFIDRSAVRMAADLSGTPHDQWIHLAVPPFEKFVLIYEPGGYIDAPDVIPEIAMVGDSQGIKWYYSVDGKVARGAFEILWEGGKSDHMAATLGWGYTPTYYQKTGLQMPQAPSVIRPDRPFAKDPVGYEIVAGECAGQVRVGIGYPGSDQ